MRREASRHPGSASVPVCEKPRHPTEVLPGAAMAGWTSLALLDVSNNRLRSLPGELGACASLESIQSGGNRLDGIPAQLAALQLLKTLELDDNRSAAPFGWRMAGRAFYSTARAPLSAWSLVLTTAAGPGTVP